MPLLKIGTRKSRLALWQTDHIIALLENAVPNLTCEKIFFVTKGDKTLDQPLPLIGGKGLFTWELENALLNNEIDLAVHSLKDLPVEEPTGLMLGAIVGRADARDDNLADMRHDHGQNQNAHHPATGVERPVVQLVHRRQRRAEHQPEGQAAHADFIRDDAVAEVHHRRDAADAIGPGGMTVRKNTYPRWRIGCERTVDSQVVRQRQAVDLDIQQLALASEHLVPGKSGAGEYRVIRSHDCDTIAPCVVLRGDGNFIELRRQLLVGGKLSPDGISGESPGQSGGSFLRQYAIPPSRPRLDRILGSARINLFD